MDQYKIIKELDGYDLIIFDLDETLVDLNVDWDGLKTELKKFCISKTGKEIEFSPLNERLVSAKRTLGTEIYEKLLEIVSEFETIESKYKINEELIDFVNKTEKNVIIYSMNTRKCIDLVISKYFKKEPKYIISKENCIEPKPTGKDLEKLMDIIVKGKKMIFIGNSKDDEESAQLAGVPFIHIDYFKKGPKKI